MNIKDTKTGQQVICLGLDTEENRKLITQDLTAAIRWYSSSNARYSGDEQSLYRIGQMLEVIHGIRKAS